MRFLSICSKREYYIIETQPNGGHNHNVTERDVVAQKQFSGDRDAENKGSTIPVRKIGIAIHNFTPHTSLTSAALTKSKSGTFCSSICISRELRYDSSPVRTKIGELCHIIVDACSIGEQMHSWHMARHRSVQSYCQWRLGQHADHHSFANTQLRRGETSSNHLRCKKFFDRHISTFT